MKQTVFVKETAHTSYKVRSEEHTSELQSPCNLVCSLLLDKNNDRLPIALPIRNPILELGALQPKSQSLCLDLHALRHLPIEAIHFGMLESIDGTGITDGGV